jgi:inhibitor of KinA sporulation pathway (predicted exonuclease)
VAQPYDFYLVLDFEATCDDTTRLQPQEVIEFPVVCVCATTRQIVWEVHSYVKPVHHPILTPFCTSLTGITQATVDAGVSFPVALAAVESKLLEVGLLPQTAGSPRFIFVTCGDWDLRSMLPRQLSVSSLPQPSYYKSWINIKIPFAQYFKLKGRGPGMDGMLQKLNLPLVGRHHSGIDDCRNIASILLTLMARGVCLTATTAPGV